MQTEALSCQESIWKCGKDGSVLVQVEYFLVTPKEWWDSPKSTDPSWRVVMMTRGRLFVHRVSTTL
jgi:hypothetical protein